MSGMKTRTLLQSFRKFTEFEDYTVLGSQYVNSFDEKEWHVWLWSGRDITIRNYEIVDRVPRQALSGKSLQAVQTAITEWEANAIPAEPDSLGIMPPEI